MTVRKLISELKKMPQNLEVEYAHVDNSEWEVAGNTCSVDHCIKKNLEEEFKESLRSLYPGDQDRFEDRPKQWVVIRG